MNKIFGIIAVTIIVLGSVLTSCYSPSERVENTLEYVRSVEKELEESKQHLKEIENYKMKASAQISSNEKSISEFQDKIAKEKLEVTEEYEPKIVELEAKNSDMKEKLDDFKSDSKIVWTKFKTEFSHDMEELGVEFKDLAGYFGPPMP